MKAIFKKLIVSCLVWEAQRALSVHKPTIVAITGSVGKTSTKDMIAAVLGIQFDVRKSEKSFNSEIGIPLAILGLANAWGSPLGWMVNIWRGYKEAKSRAFPKMLVLEVGADHPGDIKSVCEWLKPDVAVATRFPELPVHIVHFSSKESVWEEKAELIKALKPDGLLVVNVDDANILAYTKLTAAKIATYGFANEHTAFNGAFVRTLIEDKIPVGMSFQVAHKNNSFPVSIHGVLGQQLCYGALAAIAVGDHFGISVLKSADALREVELPKGRMRILNGVNGSTLIDDTYNASPVAVEAALAALAELPVKGKKIAIVGDMRELGEHAEVEHKRIGEIAARIADVVVGVGEAGNILADASRKHAGESTTEVLWFATSDEAGKVMHGKIAPGDVVLVKGSQGVRMERCAIQLLADPDKDAMQLPRQEKEWKNR